MKVPDAVGELVTPRREVRMLMGADGDDHVVRLEFAFGCVQDEPLFVARRTHSPDLHTPAIGWIEALGEALDVCDDLVAEHEALGLIAVVRKPRQLAEAVRGN
jgi:hypothetical protein